MASGIRKLVFHLACVTAALASEGPTLGRGSRNRGATPPPGRPHTAGTASGPAARPSQPFLNLGTHSAPTRHPLGTHSPPLRNLAQSPGWRTSPIGQDVGLVQSVVGWPVRVGGGQDGLLQVICDKSEYAQLAPVKNPVTGEYECPTLTECCCGPDSMKKWTQPGCCGEFFSGDSDDACMDVVDSVHDYVFPRPFLVFTNELMQFLSFKYGGKPGVLAWLGTAAVMGTIATTGRAVSFANSQGGVWDDTNKHCFGSPGGMPAVLDAVLDKTNNPQAMPCLSVGAVRDAMGDRLPQSDPFAARLRHSLLASGVASPPTSWLASGTPWPGLDADLLQESLPECVRALNPASYGRHAERDLASLRQAVLHYHEDGPAPALSGQCGGTGAGGGGDTCSNPSPFEWLPLEDAGGEAGSYVDEQLKTYTVAGGVPSLVPAAFHLLESLDGVGGRTLPLRIAVGKLHGEGGFCLDVRGSPEEPWCFTPGKSESEGLVRTILDVMQLPPDVAAAAQSTSASWLCRMHPSWNEGLGDGPRSGALGDGGGPRCDQLQLGSNLVKLNLRMLAELRVVEANVEQELDPAGPPPTHMVQVSKVPYTRTGKGAYIRVPRTRTEVRQTHTQEAWDRIEGLPELPEDLRGQFALALAGLASSPGEQCVPRVCAPALLDEALHGYYANLRERYESGAATNEQLPQGLKKRLADFGRQCRSRASGLHRALGYLTRGTEAETRAMEDVLNLAKEHCPR